MNITGATVTSTTRSSSGLGEQRSADIKWTDENDQEQALNLGELSEEHYEDLRAALAGGLLVDLVLDANGDIIAVTLRKPS